MGKATKRDMIEREEAIQTMMRRGLDVDDFAEELSKQFKCSKNAIYRQYQKILDGIIEAQKEQRDELKAKLLLKADAMYKTAVSDGRVREALSSIDLQAKIGGLYRPDQKEAEQAPPQPVFNFVKQDNSKPLAVVPKDDDDKAGSA